MIENKFIVDFKEEYGRYPLSAAYYARSLGFKHNQILQENIDCVCNFIKGDTSWIPDYGYGDNNSSSKCLCEQVDFTEMMEDIHNYPHLFDIIVVRNFNQISRSKEIIDFLLNEGVLNVPVFCVEEGYIVTSDPDNIDEYLLSRANFRENDDSSCVDDTYHGKNDKYAD